MGAIVGAGVNLGVGAAADACGSGVAVGKAGAVAASVTASSAVAGTPGAGVAACAGVLVSLAGPCPPQAAVASITALKMADIVQSFIPIT